MRAYVQQRNLFFFSSRRRNTRCYRDWSSDVCSSDLDADYRAVAQDLAEDHDHRHPGALAEAHVTGRPSGAIVRTALFAILFMGTVLVYVPYILASGPETERWTLGPWRYVGLLPLAAGIAGLAWCLRDFALVGCGTPAPFDPPRQLVPAGLYRRLRNPMYLV